MKKTLFSLMAIVLVLFGFVACDDSESISKASEKQIAIFNQAMNLALEATSWDNGKFLEGVTPPKDENGVWKCDEVSISLGKETYILSGTFSFSQTKTSLDVSFIDSTKKQYSVSAYLEESAKEAVITVNGKKYLITQDMV